MPGSLQLIEVSPSRTTKCSMAECRTYKRLVSPVCKTDERFEDRERVVVDTEADENVIRC